MTHKDSYHWFIKIALWRHLEKNRRGIFEKLIQKYFTQVHPHWYSLRASGGSDSENWKSCFNDRFRPRPVHSPVQTSLRPKHSYCIQPNHFHKDHGLHFTEPISSASTRSTLTLMNMGKISLNHS